MKRRIFLMLLALFMVLFVLGLGEQPFLNGTAHGDNLVTFLQGVEAESAVVVNDHVSSFSCFFIQPSPCDDNTYDVTGTCTIGVRETVLNTGQEKVQLQIKFTGSGEAYSLQILHNQSYDAIASSYPVAGVHYEWNGHGRNPDFESTSSGTVSISGGSPSGLSLSTTGTLCTP